MIFDFAAYLARIDPDVHYDVKPLLGGVVNLTVRATKTDNTKHRGTFAGHHSIVLKHAPPYIAAIGEEAPFSQYRQTVEARAISVATTIIHGNHNILLPRLLKHDEEEHVLVMRDLGILPNLAEIFSAVGGYNPMHIPTENEDLGWPQTEVVDPEISYYFTHIGQELGRFFGILHSPRTRDAILDNHNLGADYFSNPAAKSVVHDNEIKPLRNQLELFSDLLNEGETDVLFSRIENNFRAEVSDEEKCFILGDCWLGAVLVEPTFSIDRVRPTIGVVDWEFASIGRGFNGDIAQILAHFELLHLAAMHQNLKIHATYIEQLVKAVVIQYAATSTEEKAPWTNKNDNARASNSTSISEHRDFRLRLLRSALLSHAAEMIACSFWKIWPCSDVDCPCPRADVDSRGEPVPDTESHDAHGANIVNSNTGNSQTSRSTISFSTSPPMTSTSSATSSVPISGGTSNLASDLGLDPNVDQPRPLSLIKAPQHPTSTSTSRRTNHSPKLRFHTREKIHQCSLIRKMVRRAIWYLRVSGHDLDQFKARDNWDKVTRHASSIDHRDESDGQERGQKHGEDMAVGMGMLRFLPFIS